MPIQVIIKRKWQADKHEELIPLLTEIRSRAKKQPGERNRSLCALKSYWIPLDAM